MRNEHVATESLIVDGEELWSMTRILSDEELAFIKRHIAQQPKEDFKKEN